LKVVSPKEMMEIEKNSYEKYHLNESLIIENVGFQGANFINENLLKDDKFSEIVVLVGKGNNGSDGLSIARQLKNMDRTVRAFILFPNEIVKGSELEKQLFLARQFGVKITDVKNTEQITTYFTQTQESFLVIDAILGTGTRLPVSQFLFEIINCTNQYATTIVAIDIPSGITGDCGEMSSTAIEAHLTLAIGLPKTGCFVAQGMRHAGKIHVLDAGFPQKLLREGNKSLLLPKNVAKLVKKRDRFDHKNRFGHVLVIGGSKGLTGALILAATSALKVGAGLVTALTWEENYLELVTRVMPEVMTGTIPVEGNLVDVESIFLEMDKFSCIVLGPGLGKTKKAKQVVFEVLNHFHGPVVLDADALKVLNLKEHLEILSKRKGPTILTPHMAEFSVLSGVPVEKVLSNPLTYMQELIDETNCSFVLKGPTTFLGFPNDEILINHFPNDGLAKGGSGDVLSGIIGGIISQVKTDANVYKKPEKIYEATSLAVCLHTLAGKFASEKYGNFSMTAGSIIKNLPKAFFHLFNLSKKDKRNG
jgi:ADP-dependent NAD(P)H-hydrate dehydratase / NAD(P)H-hydrate epimerase